MIWSKVPAVWDYKEVVYTTWEMSFNLLDANKKTRLEKWHILVMLSFLNFRDIPPEIFKVPCLAVLPDIFATKFPEVHLNPPKWIQLLVTEDRKWDYLKVEDLLFDFKDLSLVQLLPVEHGTFRLSIHPLVSEWIQYRTDFESKLRCQIQAMFIVKDCLHDSLVGNCDPYISYEGLSRHAVACLDRELVDVLGWRKVKLRLANQVNLLLYSLKHDINEAYLSLTKKQIERLLKESERRRWEIERRGKVMFMDCLKPQPRAKGVPASTSNETTTWLVDHPFFQAWLHGNISELCCYGSGTFYVSFQSNIMLIVFRYI